MAESNLDRVKTFYGATDEGDIERALSICADDVEWTEAAGFPYAGTYHGVDEVVENVFARLGAEWERFGSTPEQFVTDGDTVAVVATYSGTHAETGDSFEARVVHVWQFEDGEAVSFEQVVDSAPVQAAMPD